MENNKVMNSCLMVAADLQTPVSLNSVFDSGDVLDKGISYDFHVTLLYARDRIIENSEISAEIVKACSNYQKSFLQILDNKVPYFNIYDYLKEFKEPVPVLNLFELGCFNNKDKNIIILKLRPDNNWFGILRLLNKALSKSLGVVSDFENYTPHLTLANLKFGCSEKYLNSETLKLILQGSTVRFEDLILSIGEDGIPDYKVQNLTNNCNVDRFFRIRELERESKE